MNRTNHYLLKWLEQRNTLARIFGKKPAWTIEDCKKEEVYQEIFCDLDNSLSPENLCCDGELRGRRLVHKERDLKGAWRDLANLNSLSVDYNSPELDEWHQIQDKKTQEFLRKPNVEPEFSLEGFASCNKFSVKKVEN